MQAPPRVLLFDSETNGLLHELDKIHCLVIHEVGIEGTLTFSNGPAAVAPVSVGVKLLLDAAAEGGFIVAHNAIAFDVPALQKVFPWFTPPMTQVIDTLPLARLVYPDLKLIDAKLVSDGILPQKLSRRQSLESWGYRLKCFKGEYEGDPLIADEEERKRTKWVSWNQAMEDYCVQDVVVLLKLYLKLMSKEPSAPSRALEQAVARIIHRQENVGFTFDLVGATRLYSSLVKRKLELEGEVMDVFKPRYFKDGKEAVPKRDNRTLGYIKGCPYHKVKLVEFNPGSRDHIAIWLKAKYGWEPTEYTTEGKPKVDETVLEGLPYPEAVVFTKYLIVTKRLGQLAEGKEAWLRHEKNGRIHGRVVTNGAVTGRATHSKPNIGQVPAVRKSKLGVLMGEAGGWGYESRELFGPSAGKVLVGADMSGIELRCLAHYMARFDGGEYGRIVTEGDIHLANQLAAGLPTRDDAKTFIYAFLYGAGPEKLGSIIGKGRTAGARLRAEFLKKTPALGALIEAVKGAAKRGYLTGLDGRRIPVRSAHSALNTLLQSAGAILSKQWIALFDASVEERGWRGKVEQVAWVHDEIQVECPAELAEEVGKLAVSCIEEAGRIFQFRVHITGEYKIGNNWAQTH